MRKTKLSIGLLFLTLLVSAGLILRTQETVTEARIVSVKRADVHQVVAVSGYIVYDDEIILHAASSGTVEKVYIDQGSTVAQGEAVIKLNASGQERLMSKVIQGAGAVDVFSDFSREVQAYAANGLMIRSDRNAVLRQIYVRPEQAVYAGMPIARLTSNRQLIQCTVSNADADKISPGMWAWLKENREILGFAIVETVEAAPAEAAGGMPLSIVTLRPDQHIVKPEGDVIDAEVFIAGSDDVLSLPVEAVTERDTVWQVTQGRCVEIPAEVVLCDEINAWVNLPEGMQVAIGEFQPGQRITEARE